MSELVVETPEGLTLRHEVAGAGSRAAAALIDLFLWGLAMASLVVLFSIVLRVGGLAVWVVAGWILSLIGYHVVFGILWQGATPGKRVLGLAVADEEGLPARPVQHVLRGIFWPIEAFLLIPLPLGVILMAATPRHQRLGDRVAGTLVLRNRAPWQPAEPFKSTRWSELETRKLALVPAHAARFDGRDVAFLRELLGRRQVEPVARERMLQRAARHYVGVLELELPSRLSASDARIVLSELFVFLREMRARD